MNVKIQKFIMLLLLLGSFFLPQSTNAASDFNSDDIERQIEMGNYSYCDHDLKDDYYPQNRCRRAITARALKLKDISICPLVKSDFATARCFDEYIQAGLATSINDCKKVKDAKFQTICGERYVYNEAEVYRDEVKADSHTIDSTNDYTKHIGACAMLKKDQKDDCFFLLATKTKSPELCSKISIPREYFNNRVFRNYVYFGRIMTKREACPYSTHALLNFNTLTKIYYPIVLLFLIPFFLLTLHFRTRLKNKKKFDLICGVFAQFAVLLLLAIPEKVSYSEMYHDHKMLLDDSFVTNRFFIFKGAPAIILWPVTLIAFWWHFIFILYFLMMTCWRKNKYLLIPFFLLFALITGIRFLLAIAAFQN